VPTAPPTRATSITHLFNGIQNREEFQPREAAAELLLQDYNRLLAILLSDCDRAKNKIFNPG
jgi:hypothetical protein